jgi:hypothetical protein
MKRYSFAAGLALAALIVAGLVSPQEAKPGEPEGNIVSAYARDAQGVRVIWGDFAIIDGSRVATWALVSPHDQSILAVGVTFDLDLAEDMPDEGAGPAGAIASLDFPAIVQEATFFYHLEVQSNPHGHATPPGNVNPNRNAVPHFDFHFYSIPEELVWLIPGQKPPPAPPAVPADLLPAGYRQPGPSIAEMGRHAAPNWSFTDPNPLSTIMLAGFLPDGSSMHFLEPMISRDVLLGGENFTLDVPMPRAFGREMLYPTHFDAVFHGNACSLVYSDFVTVR